VEKEHVLSDEALQKATAGLADGRHWVAFNPWGYFIEGTDLHLFRDKQSAGVFADGHSTPIDKYQVVRVESLQDLNRILVHGHSQTHYLKIYPDVIFEKHQSIYNSKITVMNEKNFEYLQKQLKLTGFGEGHTEKLKEGLQQQKPEFTLFHQQDYGKDNTVATLHFRKSNDTDMYFFNRYNLLLKNDQHPDPVKQTFYINQNQSNITQKEGYNLLSGRAVEKEIATKEGNKYQAWLQLNFKETDKHGNYMVKQFHQNYGFDLEKTLAKLPIKELAGEESKTRLLESLQRGNRQSVTLQVGDTERKAFIEAAPQFKSLNLYDEHMKRVHAQTLLTPAGEAKQDKEVKKEAKQKQAVENGDGEGATKQKKSRSRKQGISS
jgi:hypothetical protein